MNGMPPQRQATARDVEPFTTAADPAICEAQHCVVEAIDVDVSMLFELDADADQLRSEASPRYDAERGLEHLRRRSEPRWQRMYNAGAGPQRVLWSSTGTKDPKASDDLYIKALAAPFTVNTIPEATSKALADRGTISGFLPADGGNCE